jgi:hypothetical protein
MLNFILKYISVPVAYSGFSFIVLLKYTNIISHIIIYSI